MSTHYDDNVTPDPEAQRPYREGNDNREEEGDGLPF
jgi:hypothetical protein